MPPTDAASFSPEPPTSSRPPVCATGPPTVRLSPGTAANVPPAIAKLPLTVIGAASVTAVENAVVTATEPTAMPRSHEQPLKISDEPKTTRWPADGTRPTFQFAPSDASASGPSPVH